jgi:hypothetical protein
MMGVIGAYKEPPLSRSEFEQLTAGIRHALARAYSAAQHWEHSKAPHVYAYCLEVVSSTLFPNSVFFIKHAILIQTERLDQQQLR